MPSFVCGLRCSGHEFAGQTRKFICIVEYQLESLFVCKHILGKLGAEREGQPVPAFDLTGRVVKIMDGDSLSLLDAANRQHTIRLYGIDTPEWDQPHGGRAKKALARLVDGRNIGVVKVDTDPFNRTVGTVFVGDTNVNLAMIEAGHAWWFARYAPYERHLAAAEEDAREQRLGLWSKGDPVPPWQWRRNQRR